MTEEFCIREIPVRYAFERNRLSDFLARHRLAYEEDVEVAFGIFGPGDALVGCGCAAGAILKCFAVEPVLRGQNALGMLVSALLQERFAAGQDALFVVTRRENEPLFTACGLFSVARTDALCLLENQPDGPERFIRPFLRPGDADQTVGAIVMNCNPFTLGHRGLIEYAAGQCGVLHLFVVEEDRSVFPLELRHRMVQEGVADLAQVRVHLSGRYMISNATFPTYFLKADEDAAGLQAELDITLFAQRIAPALHITKRFAGQEPLDPLTDRYNSAMRAILPVHGIELCELPRLERDGEVISASRVRSLLATGQPDRAFSLVPESTHRYLHTERGWQVIKQLQSSGAALHREEYRG